eukprot:gnl/Ergobibamus_cyprinoides/1163.p3 GENE.gnl/Ergobibamus_cyprinoides/1163~~gnl/Ergobibamus_cyprinoides/1163.p3  ORF type:complete len:120 (+),score=51.06 gnl/Ergobibamus_cyprinoides/1163:538-897(+)
MSFAVGGDANYQRGCHFCRDALMLDLEDLATLRLYIDALVDHGELADALEHLLYARSVVKARHDQLLSAMQRDATLQPFVAEAAQMISGMDAERAELEAAVAALPPDVDPAAPEDQDMS